MKKLSFVLLMMFGFHLVMAWGITGHRTVGHIAENHLSRKATKKLSKILDGASLAEVSTWMDEIKSDPAYDHTHDWHWVSIPDGNTYDETTKNPNGDIIATIERLTEDLKKGGLEAKQEAEHVKMLVHLIGDIHQPLHVGTGDDQGGNAVRVSYFRETSNLHRVWDTQMIESNKYSYTELANVLDKEEKAQVKKWQDSNVRDWAAESVTYRDVVYDLPEDERLSYPYLRDNTKVVNLRLVQAGVRLAKVLNDIYG